MQLTSPALLVIQQAEQCLANGDAREAINFLDRAPAKVGGPERAHLDFLRGRALLALSKYADATPFLRAAVQAQKSNPAYRMSLGAALHFSGQLEDAVQHYREAIRLAPTAENPPFNLGTVLYQAGDHEGAERAYRLAISRKPNFVDALVALADLLLVKKDFAEAERLLSKAIATDPSSANAACVLGTAYERSGQLAMAEAQFERAVLLDKGYAQAWFHLGHMRGQRGANDDALTALNRAIAIEPGNEKFRFIFSLYADHGAVGKTGIAASKMPDVVVKELFDEYAATFDESLVEKLGYRTPEHIHAALQGWLTQKAPIPNALDLGCGTGLMGPLLEPYVSELTGVDISAKMLEKAEGRGYSKLHCAEIETFLANAESSSQDLILAADVFVYIGELRAIFGHVGRILRAHGRFAFSIESLDAAPDISADISFHAGQSGRFAHRKKYIAQLVAERGLLVKNRDDVVLRMDAGQEVIGAVYVLAPAPDGK